MASVIGPFRRAGGALWTLCLPALLVSAGLGAGFALIPRHAFEEEDPRRLRSSWNAESAAGTVAYFEAQPGFTSRFHPRVVIFSWRRPVDPADADRPPVRWKPGGAVEVRWSRDDERASGLIMVGVGWWAAWAAVLSLVWWPWAWRTGRFAGTERRGRWAVAGRAARPWVLTLAALGGLCLAVPHGAWGESRLMAELRRDPHVPWHPRALWLGWNDLTPTAGDGPAAPLWGGRRWGVTAERSGWKTFSLALPDRDEVFGGRRTAWAVSLWYVFLPAAAWSAVSLRGSWRLQTEPTAGGSSAR